ASRRVRERHRRAGARGLPSDVANGGHHSGAGEFACDRVCHAAGRCAHGFGSRSREPVWSRRQRPRHRPRHERRVSRIAATFARALEAATAARKRTDVPLLFMTYLNPILAYGLERFCRAASEAGVDGLIVPDLPPAESADLRRAADAAQVDLVFFVAPTSSEASIAAACRAANGFIYCIAVTGVTGARAELDPALLPLIEIVRRHTKLPIVVGFGISRVE